MLWKSLKYLFPSSFPLVGLIAAVVCFFFTMGCSSGSGGTNNPVTGVDPIEVEVNAALDTFLAGIAAKNIDIVMDSIDSNLQYRRINTTKILRYDDFKGLLQTFFNGAASISIAISDRGIVSNGENGALVRGTLIYSYLDSQNVFREKSEKCEIVYERISKWGITSFSGLNLEGLIFPPIP